MIQARGEESQRSLAKYLGFAPTTLIEVEKGRANPTLRRITELGDYYGIKFRLVADIQEAKQ